MTIDAIHFHNGLGFRVGRAIEEDEHEESVGVVGHLDANLEHYKSPNQTSPNII